MSDLIDRNDAVEVVYNALRMPRIDYKKDPFHDSMSLAIAMIKEIPSIHYEDKWIPVTEALPEEETDVLVTVHFDGHKSPTIDLPPSDYVEIASHVDGFWSSLSDEYKAAWKKHHVVAWMPTPDPLRGD